MLTQAQINQIVRKFNAKFDLPLLSERAEASVLDSTIKQMLKHDSVVSLLKDPTASHDAIIDDLNSQIEIPMIGELTEKRLLNTLLAFMRDAVNG